MTTTALLSDADLAALLSMLDALDGEIQADIEVVEEKLSELRRQAKAASQRRSGAGSRDAHKYALGSVLAMVGLETVEPRVLLGLFAHPDLLLRWMIEARSACGSANFGELIARIFADPARVSFCRQWGRILEWRYRKPLYDAAVTSFVESGHIGLKKVWRKHDVSDDQTALVAKLCDLLDEPLPHLETKGEAFEWIYARGGNPQYWAEPPIPDEWRD
ncbi:MAG: hypothetical protein EOP62_20715 [Sphingomonadales bacterium]|nr:MAG: hypothetical protein EOP62_20715 [Sphingomonadales bacterium]